MGDEALRWPLLSVLLASGRSGGRCHQCWHLIHDGLAQLHGGQRRGMGDRRTLGADGDTAIIGHAGVDRQSGERARRDDADGHG